MKKMMKVFAVACLSAMTLTACSNESTPTTDGNTGGDVPSGTDTVTIGLNYELTGGVADYGTAESKGSKLAIKLANEAAGTEKYAYIEYDNKSDETESITLATQLAADGVVGVVGPATSGASAATYPILNESKVPVVSPSATANNQTLVNPDDPTSAVYDYVYRICFEDSYQGAAMAQYAYDTLGAKKVAIYGSSSSDYALGLKEAFTAQFEKLGGSIVASEAYQDGDTDFSSVLTTLASQDFDALYIPGYYSEAGLIIKQARDMGITQPIIGADGFDSVTLIELAGASALNDVYFTTAYTTVDASDKLQAFVDAYKAEYNEEPGMFAALAFDSVNLLLHAVEEAQSTDPEAVQKALSAISFSGVTGDFTFDETHTPLKSVLVVTLEDGVQTTAVSVSPAE